MPILSCAQTLPQTTQVATVRPVVRLSAAQAVPADGLAATIAAPRVVLAADQGMGAGTVRARFRFGAVRGAAVSRPPGLPAVPRNGHGRHTLDAEFILGRSTLA